MSIAVVTNPNSTAPPRRVTGISTQSMTTRLADGLGFVKIPTFGVGLWRFQIRPVTLCPKERKEARSCGN